MATQETVKQLNVGGVLRDIEDVDARTAAAGKYTKPSSGIPKTDLSQEVQSAIDNAGSGSVTGVKIGSTTYEPTNGVVDVSAGIPDVSSKLSQSDVSVETQGDGTVDINVGSDTYSINLNHTHENMVRLVICEEADLPATLATDTIYAQVDDATSPTEIESLWIAGLEFVGGGSTRPKLSQPANGSTINIGMIASGNNSVSKTIVVAGVNLTQPLTISFGTGTDFSADKQTIPAADANAGTTLVITCTSSTVNIEDTLSISSSEVSIECDLIANIPPYEALTAVKTTGSQWIDTGYVPGPGTSFELDCKFVGTNNTNNTSSANNCCVFLHAKDGTEKFRFQTNYGEVAYSVMAITGTQAAPKFQHNYGQSAMNNVRSTLSYSNGSISFLGVTGETVTQSANQSDTLTIGYNYSNSRTFDVFDLWIYGFKIYDSGTLVRDYKPAIYENHIGLYDVVNNTFISSETNTELEAIS